MPISRSRPTSAGSIAACERFNQGLHSEGVEVIPPFGEITSTLRFHARTDKSTPVQGSYWLRSWILLDLLDIREEIRPFQIRFSRPIEANEPKPAFTGIGLQPVRLVTLRGLGSEVKIHGAVTVCHQIRRP